MRNTRWAAAFCVLGLVTAACGGDSSSDTTYRDTLTTADRSWDDSNRDDHSSDTTAAGSATTAAAASEVGEPYPDVEFDDPGVNRPEWTDEDKLSTFALDVDTGAYTVARTFLNDGFLPDRDSVRVEEYVNFFAQDYPVPRQGFSITVDGGPTPFVDEDMRVIRIGLRAEDVESRPASNLVFVIDTSGSMAEGRRLEIVKYSLSLLVEELTEQDTVTLVEFGSDARLVLPPTFGDEKREILRALDHLEPGGSTNFEHGLRLGYDAADQLRRDGRLTRVIVASDGVANVGLSDPDSLVEMIRRDADRGVNLVTVGVGMGNYNDALLEQLADDGDGFYAYVDTPDEAQDLFVNDLTGTLVTVAEDARVQVEFDQDTVLEWRLVGYENRAIADDQFRDDTVDAGEIGAGHTVTALYEVRLTRDALAGREDRIGRVYLRWLDPRTDDPTEVSQTISLKDLSDRYRDTAPRFQQDVVVAQFAEALRGSRFAGVWTLDDLVDHAYDVTDLLPGDEDVAEFAELVRMSARLER
ncbi:MAG: von Willebrand factor type A domain-containing protein [Acidimicrobiia bacterium]|nr:von Willebrand factor type A domain-containing protein [Acidimicrobiia bacterium]